MDTIKLKTTLTRSAGECMAALLLVQPLLDVLSYFMQNLGMTALTTALRTVLLFAVSLYGFAISDRKRLYGLLWGVAGGFWLLHMLNCFRLGYQDPVGDAAEYLKLVQFPLWTAVFLTFFRQRPGLDLRASALLAGNFALILLVIGLSYLTGRPAYTYDLPARDFQKGLLGWFGVPNAQSAIVSMLAPGLLLWAWRTERLWVFSGACGLGLGLLYFTGTRLTYYSAVLVVLGFLVLLGLVVLGGGDWKRILLFCAPLALMLVLVLAFRGQSVMAQRQALTADAYASYQAQTDRILGEGWTYQGGEPSQEELEKITRVYEEIYTQKSVANTPLLGGLLERFGVQRVMEQYHYSTEASTLYNSRTKKLAVMALTWREQDWITRIFGFEYAKATINGVNYDPENDFPALPYFYGYLGAALYLGFTAYFLLAVLWGCVKNWRTLPGFLTVELGAYSMLYCLGLCSAQFSGQALRKPSVTVYLSLAAAQMYWLTRPNREGKLFAKYRRRSAVVMKQL